MNPFAQALLDFHAGNENTAFLIIRDDGYQQKVPASGFFDDSHFSPLEELALNHCRGGVLDIGSGAGRHSLELTRREFEVTALDILPEVGEIMKNRGLKNVAVADVYQFSQGRYDTLLMMMNGIGMTGSMDGLRNYLNHAHTLTAPGGQILCDSIDVYVTDNSDHTAYREKNLAHNLPAGQQTFHIEYKGVKSPPFNWLHIDFKTLSKESSALGWEAELLEMQEDGQYLCKITSK